MSNIKYIIHMRKKNNIPYHPVNKQIIQNVPKSTAEKRLFINIHGGLCNNLFQLASGYGLSKKHERSFYINRIDDNYHKTTDYYFFNNFSFMHPTNPVYLKEKEHDCTRYNDILNNTHQHSDILLDGYFQNEKYFKDFKKEIIETLNLKKSSKESLLKYSPNNKYFIHIRRGDYLNLQVHNLNLAHYYSKAITYIKLHDLNASFLIFSDDIDGTKKMEMFDGLTNYNFVEGLNELESLILMSECSKGGICCNSSYSWWGSYLNLNSNKIVIFPNKWFNNNWSIDIQYENSIIFEINDKNYQKIDLSETTFIIPVKIDSTDRLINANITLNYIISHFNTNIILLEADKISHWQQNYFGINEKDRSSINYIFVENQSEIFHKTKYIDTMLNFVKTSVVAIYDIDILLPVETYKFCQDLILNKYDFLFPFTNGPGVFLLDNNLKTNIFGNNYTLSNLNLREKTQVSTLPGANMINAEAGPGFCHFVKTNCMKIVGGDNINFKSYGPEDAERAYKFIKLGFSVPNNISYHKKMYHRSNSNNEFLCMPVFHQEHWRGDNSSESNKFYEENVKLFNTITNFSENELLDYYLKYSQFDYNKYEEYINKKMKPCDLYKHYIQNNKQLDFNGYKI